MITAANQELIEEKLVAILAEYPEILSIRITREKNDRVTIHTETDYGDSFSTLSEIPELY